jgi:hypothetical protein
VQLVAQRALAIFLRIETALVKHEDDVIDNVFEGSRSDCVGKGESINIGLFVMDSGEQG